MIFRTHKETVLAGAPCARRSELLHKALRCRSVTKVVPKWPVGEAPQEEGDLRSDRKSPSINRLEVVGDTGLEPVTSTV